MNDFALYIFSQKREENIQYTFVLEEPGSPPVIGNRRVPTASWSAIEHHYHDISNATGTYIKKLSANGVAAHQAEAFRNDYKEIISHQMGGLSDLIRNSFWPKQYDVEGAAFYERFCELEREAVSSPRRPHLLIASNESKMPWWVAQGASPNENLLLCELFALGIISLRANQPRPTRLPPPIRIRVITCPTLDLVYKDDASYTEVNLEHIEKELHGVADYGLLSGRTAPPYGLSEQQLTTRFKEGTVVLYHGHFTLDTASSRIEYSTIWAKGTDRNPRTPNDIRLGALASNNALDNKNLIFIGCETAGMHPNLDETLGEYLARHSSTLIGTLYPILDEQARSFANELSKALFVEHLSWGEAVRKSREKAKQDGSLFYRAAYCYFGVPWQMSPLFEARKNLHVLVPAYLKSVYELVRPEKVYSSVLQEDFPPTARLEAAVRDYEDPLKKDREPLVIAALPSVFVAELLQESDEWVVLGPMVASEDDVRVVATQAGIENFSQPEVWQGKKIVFKGPRLTASAFLEVLLNKWGISTEKIQWNIISTDCAAVIEAGLADIGLIVAREDLSGDQRFPGGSSLSVDSALAEDFYNKVPIPRILWITKRTCTEGWRRYYIIEFFKRLCERIGDDEKIDKRAVPGSEVLSKVRLYRMNNEAEIKQAKQTLRSFLTDWAALDVEKRRPIPDECFYDWSETGDKPQA